MSFHNLRIDKFNRAPMYQTNEFPLSAFSARPLCRPGSAMLDGPITIWTWASGAGRTHYSGLGYHSALQLAKKCWMAKCRIDTSSSLWLRKKCRIRKMLHRHFFLFVIKEKVSSQKKNEKLWPKNVNLQFENESEIFLMFQTILNMNVTISYSMMNIYSMRMKHAGLVWK